MDASTPRRVYEFGEYRLDALAQTLATLDGREIPLTPRVFDTLLSLVEHAGELLDKRWLMQRVWPTVVVEENNLDQNISTLRQILGERPGDNRYIVTVRGRGYRFVAAVRLVSAEGDTASSAPSGPASPDVEASLAAASAETEMNALARVVPSGWARRRRWLVGAAAIVVAAAGAAVIGSLPRTPLAKPATPAPVLAVLPFRPLALEDRNESLELGMAETLIAGLNGAGIDVRPLSAVRRYAGAEQDAVLAGRALGVSAVLEGYIQRDGARLRASARLIDVAAGRQLWSGSFDEAFTDVFTVQDTIAARVRSALLPELMGERHELAHGTRDAEAYQAYINGRFHRGRSSETNLRQSLAYFEEAIVRDPNFAEAYVGLAETHSILAVFGIDAPREAFPKAQRALTQALALAPDLGQAYASLGHIKVQYEHDWDGAERAYRRAIELEPGFAPAHQWLGTLLAARGEFEEGLASLRRAQSAEPSSPVASAVIGLVLTYQRRHDEAVEQLTATLGMEPSLPTAHAYIAGAYLRRGQFERARAHLAQAASSTPGTQGYVGLIHALSGDRAAAQTEAARLEALAAERYVPAYDIATVHAALGDVEATFTWLERAFEERSGLIVWLAWDEVFDVIRADPRYPAMLARLPAGDVR